MALAGFGQDLTDQDKAALYNALLALHTCPHCRADLLQCTRRISEREGFGSELTQEELQAGALRAARTILARHVGCCCSLCTLATSIELDLAGVSHER